MARAAGDRHGKWTGGKTVTPNGYVRITAGPFRGQYEHRAIAKQLWLISYGTPLPDGKEVHHMDWDRGHNCPSNLLILDAVLHEKHNHCHRVRSDDGRFVPASEMPDWVTEEVA